MVHPKLLEMSPILVMFKEFVDETKFDLHVRYSSMVTSEGSLSFL